MNDIVIIGGGGHAKVVISLLRKLGSWHLFGYTDPKDHGQILGVRFLGPDSVLRTVAAENPKLLGVIGVGQIGLGTLRCSLLQRLQCHFASFPPIVSTDATVNESVLIGDGAIIMDGAVVNCGARIGRGAIINTNSTVEHDCTVGEWVHIAPGATVCGNSSVGDYSMVGAGATIIEGISLTASSVIGAGATVIADVTESGVYVGCPARLLRHHG